MAWASLLIVFAAYLLVVLAGVGGRALEDCRAAWLTIAASPALWAAGEVVWALAYEQAPELAPYPSVADALWLGAYVAAAVGLIALMRARLGGSLRATVLLDAAMGATAVGALVAALAFDPVLRDTQGLALEVATDLAYPFADLCLLALVTVMLTLTGWRPGLGWAAFALAVALQAGSDVVYAREIALGIDAEAAPLAPIWPAATLLLAYAAWRPLPAPPPRRVPRARVFVYPATFAVLALGVLLYAHFAAVNHVAAVLAAATVTLAVARMALGFAENLRMLRRARRDALTDSLTRLRNRRSLMEDLVAELDPVGARRELVLAIYDLDGFKRYNDAYGHPAGDALLDRLGSKLAAAVSGRGRAYRLGGDEFCVLAEAPVGEAVLDAAAVALSECGDGFTVTCSHGTASLPGEAGDAAAALQLADRRLYARKDSRPSGAGLQTRTVLLKVLSEREPNLHEHSADVMSLAREVARRLGIEAEERETVARAAELHDIGKMAIPDAILNKPGPLDEHEWSFMRRHTIIGEDILNAAPALQPVAALVRASHERWDGEGYPDGTAGEEIPEGARIVAVCDAFSAMTQDRPYHPGMSVDEAVEEIERCAGANFDPRVVAAFAAEIDVEALAGVR